MNSTMKSGGGPKMSSVSPDNRRGDKSIRESNISKASPSLTKTMPNTNRHDKSSNKNMFSDT